MVLTDRVERAALLRPFLEDRRPFVVEMKFRAPERWADIEYHPLDGHGPVWPGMFVADGWACRYRNGSSSGIHPDSELLRHAATGKIRHPRHLELEQRTTARAAGRARSAASWILQRVERLVRGR